MQIPDDLCPVHREIAKGWRDNHFDIWNPGEWPAGRSVTSGERTLLMDNRTTVDEREAEFERKNREQVELTIRICRSGRSPQCTPGHRDRGTSRFDHALDTADVEPPEQPAVPAPRSTHDVQLVGTYL
ncbi:hypothetical protein [Streptomyces yunnanensis]|nr:hypothetical protein [Streptomyces yunnanensis]